MTPSPPDYLAELYQLDQLEGWRLLARQLELTDGFSFVVVLAPDDVAIAYLRSRLPEIVGPAPEAVHRVVFDPSANIGRLAESLLDLELPDWTRLIWVDADPVDPNRIPQRDEAWQNALARLNRYRNSLQSRIRCTLALALPFSLQTILREAAPDLWSIRSLVIRIEPIGSARIPDEFNRRLPSVRAESDDIGLTGDPATTLAEVDKIRGKPGGELLLAQLLRRAGRQAYHLLNWDLAIRCLQEAYTLEETHGGDPELRFHIANELARVYQRLEKWDRALHYSRKALEICQTYFGPTHENNAVALNNLAMLLKDTNRPAAAEPLIRLALQIDEQKFGSEHPKVATHLNNLAQLLQDTNRLAEAEPLMRRALAIDEHSYGHEHPKIAIRLNNLAQLLQATNRLAEAEPLMRRALAIDEQSYGHEHPNVATDLNNLAALLQDTNRLAEAEPLMRRVVTIMEQSYGKSHPSVATALNNLSQLLQATNRLGEAEPLMRRALAIDEQSYGYEHPNIATDLNNLAALLQAANRLGEAEPLYERAVGILFQFQQDTGYQHPNFNTFINNFRRFLIKSRGLSKDEAVLRTRKVLGLEPT